MRKLLYIICLSTLASCHLATNSTPSDADSVPQSVFAPLETDTVMPVNLQLVTGLQFPKYRVLSETPFVPDTASIAAYEEQCSQWTPFPRWTSSTVSTPSAATTLAGR